MKKRLCALLLAALTLTFSAVSCNKDSGDGDVNKPRSGGETVGGEAAEKPTLLTNVFSSAMLTPPDGYEISRNFEPVYDAETKTVKILAAKQDRKYDDEGNFLSYTNDNRIFSFDADGNVVGETPVNPTYKTTNEEGEEVEEQYWLDTAAICGKTFYFITSNYDSNTGEQTYYLHAYDTETGEIRDSGELSLMFSSTERGWFYISSMTASPEGFIYLVADSEIVVLDTSFVKQFSTTVSSWVNAITVSPNGKAYVSSYFTDKYGIAVIDTENKSLGKPVSISDDNVHELTFDSEGNLYASGKSGIYKVNPTDGTSEIVLNYENSNINASASELKSVVNGETILISVRNDTTYRSEYYICKKADDIDISNLKVVEFVTPDYLPDEFPAAVVKYNREHKDSRIITKSYQSYSTNEDYYGSLKQLYKDVSLGIYKPDVIIESQYYSRYAGVSVGEYLIKNGMFVDLYTLMDKSSKIDKNDIFASVKDAFSTEDGKLFAITDGFGVDTLIGATETLGGRTSWTLSEFIDFAKSIPAGSSVFEAYITQENILQSSMLGSHIYDEFIDMENGTCNFECDDFYKFLEYIKTLPKEYRDDSSDESYYAKYQTGRVLLYQDGLFSTDSWISSIATFGGKDYTVIGYPTTDGSGRGSELNLNQYFMITTNCEHPDVAFDFIADYITPVFDEMRGAYRSRNFPIFRSAVEKLCDYAGEMEYFFYLDGGWSTRSKPEEGETSSRADRDEEGFLMYFTEEDKKTLIDFLENKCRGPKMTAIPTEVSDIIKEEVSSYTSGVKSAEQCANVVQSRVKLWLAEHD